MSQTPTTPENETSSVGETSAVDRLSRELLRETAIATEAPPVDWESVDAKLFARIKVDAEEKRRRGAHVMWLPVAGGLAAAAAITLLVGRGHDAPGLDGFESPTAEIEPAAGAIVAREGDGELLIDGRVVATGTTGTTVGAHAVVETRGGARVLVERKGQVAFWVEPASRIVVTRSRGALVIALDRGALEAKVTPVSNTAQAFAVDVGASRVAVHGTHFRVARDGSRAVVDLTEGVVSIGAAAAFRGVGATYGELVTAPAHAEFAIENAVATLTIDHSPSAVRAAVAFAIPAPVAVAPTAPVALAPTAPTTSPTPTAPAPIIASAPKLELAPSAQPPAIATPDPHAESTIARAVRACLAARPPAPGVKLIVSTVIDLQVNDEGTVQLAHFNPPLAPEAQACATAAIYRVRFTRSATVSIPIDYQYAQ